MGKASKDPNRAYEVGYGKPPKATRFQPGQSGNSKGRPRGQPSLSAILLEEIARVVKVQTGGDVIELPKKRALVRKLLEKALQGDIAAHRLVLALIAQAEQILEAAGPSEDPLSSDELAVLSLLTQKPE